MNKKNLAPLLGVAFVVAVLSTWIFYSLVAGKLTSAANASGRSVVVATRAVAKGATVSGDDIKVVAWSGGEAPAGALSMTVQAIGATALEDIRANEPLTGTRVASVDGSAGAAMGVPKGMRAVSLQVSDSAGVLTMLKAGNRVDVQAIQVRGGSMAEVEVRTILENMQVLRVSTPEPGPKQASVVTLLAKPGEADILAAAEAGAKVRLTLRNPLDSGNAGRAGVSLGGVMQGRVSQAGAALDSPAASPVTPATFQTPRVAFDVRLASAPAGTYRKDAPQAALVKSSAELEGLRTLGESRVVAENNRFASWVAPAASGYGLRIRVRPALSGGGKMRIRLEPELNWSKGQGINARRLETEMDVQDGQSVVVAGLAGDSGSDVVVVVTARVIEPLRSAGLR